MTASTAEVAGAILSGGRSRRMGTTKALVHVDGVAMAQRVDAALRSGGCYDVAMIGGDRAELAPLGLQIVDDRHPGEGPVGGVLTALHHFDGRPVLVAACDLPLLTAATVGRLLEAFEAGDADVTAAFSTQIEPLCAVWRATSRSTVQSRFDGGVRAMHRLLDGCTVERVTVDADTMRNINRPGDLAPVTDGTAPSTDRRGEHRRRSPRG